MENIKKENNNELKKWFDACDFCEDIMAFYSYQDFCKNKERIKRIYQLSNWRIKHMYRYYVFAKDYISNSKKHIIWDYLNKPNDEID